MKDLVVEVPGLAGLWPEAIVVTGALLVLLMGAFMPRRRLLLSGVALTSLVSAAVVAVVIGRQFGLEEARFEVDPVAVFLKVVLFLTAVMTILASGEFLDREAAPAGEFIGLVLFATVGMTFMTSATNWLMVFISLETFSLALYVLVAFRKKRADSQEGALKYFLTGSFATAFFLFGVALSYGAYGHMGLVFSFSQPLAAAAAALILVGLVFKIAAVPFHMWAPDAYEGAPAPVTGFMAAGSKVAAFAVLLRAVGYHPVLVVIAGLTIVFGSFVAVTQSNVKRMLAYSAIAHSGFLLIGVLAENQRGVSGSLFYLATYSLVIVGAFAVVYAVGTTGESRVSLDNYAGLAKRHPFLASSFAILLVSLAGIPPTSGFWAKFEVFSAGASADLIGLVILALLASAVAAFFYLRVIVLMFLSGPPEWSLKTEPTTLGTGLAVVGGLTAAVAGVFPEPILAAARAAATFL